MQIVAADNSGPGPSMNRPSPIPKKLQTLIQIAAALRGGDHFNITRLTILKGFCAAPQAAAKLALHTAKLTRKKLKPAKAAMQERYRRLIDDTVRTTARHQRKPVVVTARTAT